MIHYNTLFVYRIIVKMQSVHAHIYRRLIPRLHDQANIEPASPCKRGINDAYLATCVSTPDGKDFVILACIVFD